MKKIIFLFTLWCFCLPQISSAQDDSLFTDSTIAYSYLEMMDSCFKHVDLGQVPTGILIEKVMATTNVFTEFLPLSGQKIWLCCKLYMK